MLASTIKNIRRWGLLAPTFAVWTALLTPLAARGDGELAVKSATLRGASGVVFVIDRQRGLTEIHVGERLLARGAWVVENSDRLFGLGDGEVRFAPLESADFTLISADRVVLRHRPPDAQVEYDYRVDGDDLRLTVRIDNRHQQAAVAAVCLRELRFGHFHPERSHRSFVGWNRGYLGHPSNHDGVFLRPDGRTRQRQMLALADDGLGISASPLIVDDVVPPTFLMNMVSHGMQNFADERHVVHGLDYYARIDLAAGDSAALGFLLRIVPEGANWVDLLTPYRHYWRQVRLMRAEEAAESETIKRMQAEGAAPGAIDTVRQSEMFARELARRQSAASQDARGPLRDLLPRVEIGFYPSYGKLVCRVDLGRLERSFPRQLHDMAVRVSDEAGHVVAESTLRFGDETVGNFALELPPLAEGDYHVVAAIDGYDQPWTQRFTWKDYEWRGNSLGLVDQPLPPFTPLVRDDRTVKVVLREYELGDLGLLSAVKAQGRELLAAPIRLVVNGEQTLTGSGRFVATTDLHTVYEGRAEHPAMTVETRTVTEFDGCMKVELTLLPVGVGGPNDPPNPEPRTLNPEPLRSLWLDIPLRDEMAPFWHATTSGLRSNPAGRTPPGEGVVWTSQRMWADGRPRRGGHLLTNFKPYFWFGGDERGLAWFADNDKGWVLDVAAAPDRPAEQPPAQTILRENGQLILRLHLVQRPFTITEPRTITFGLMATPAKPMPDGWRSWTTTVNAPDLAPHQRFIAWMMQYWGADTHWANRYPRNRDLDVLDILAASRRGERVDMEAFIERFVERNYAPGMPEGWKPKEQVLSLLRLMPTPGWLGGANWRPRNHLGFVYYEEMLACNPLHEEFQVYQDEWTGSFRSDVHISAMVESYRDFGVWYAREFTKRGFALYFDNVFPERVHDPITTDAYPIGQADERLAEDSARRIQPAVRMWAMRDYLRRLWTITRTDGSEDFPTGIYIHMTNTDIAPWLVWADVILDMEYPLSNRLRQEVFSPDVLRAASHGRRTGSVSTALTHIGGPSETRSVAAIDRSRFGALMVHEIRPSWSAGHGEGQSGVARELYRRLLAFGYGRDDCRVRNYWDDEYPVQVSHPLVKTLLLERGGQAMLLVCGWNAAASKVEFVFDEEGLGFAPHAAVDVEDEQWNGSLESGRMRLELPPYGVQLIRLEGARD